MKLGYVSLSQFAKQNGLDRNTAKRAILTLNAELGGLVVLQIGRAIWVKADVMQLVESHLTAERVRSLSKLSREVHRQRRRTRERDQDLEARIIKLEQRIDELTSLMVHDGAPRSTTERQTDDLSNP